MEIGKRIIMEGAWIESNKDIEFYPVHTIYKVKILKERQNEKDKEGGLDD